MVPLQRFTAILDACTMYPMLVRDVLLVDQRGTGLSAPDITLHRSIGAALGESIGSEHATSALVETFRAAAREMSDKQIDLNVVPAGSTKPCQNPTGVAIAPGFNKAFVNCWGTRQLGVVDFSNMKLAVMKTSRPGKLNGSRRDLRIRSATFVEQSGQLELSSNTVNSSPPRRATTQFLLVGQ